MDNIIIASWNSVNESDIEVITSLSFDRIYICPSTESSIKLFDKVKHNRIKLFSTESPLYNESLQTIKQFVGSDDIAAYKYFSNDVCGLLQADRLNLNDMSVTEIYLKRQRLNFYWLNFILSCEIKFIYFPMTPHTFSDYELLRAARYLKILGLISRHSHDCNLISTFLDLELKPVKANRCESDDRRQLNHNIANFASSLYLNPYHKEVDSSDKYYKLNLGLNKQELAIDADKRIQKTVIYRNESARLSNKRFECKLIYYMHIEPEMTLNPSSYPLITQGSILQYLGSTFKEEIILKEHPHLIRNLAGEYGNNYRKYRKHIYNYLSGRADGFEYIGLLYDNHTLIGSGSVPISATGDICIEASLLGVYSIMCTDWWGIRDDKRYGIFSPDEWVKLGETIDQKFIDSDLIEERMRLFEREVSANHSHSQTIYKTEFTKYMLMPSDIGFEQKINEALVQTLNQYFKDNQKVASSAVF